MKRTKARVLVSVAAGALVTMAVGVGWHVHASGPYVNPTNKQQCETNGGTWSGDPCETPPPPPGTCESTWCGWCKGTKAGDFHVCGH